MFDIGWSELLLIGIVALIVVGPKDLPKMFRTVGQLMGKARGMAREFTRAMEAAADDAGVKDAAKTFRDTASGRSLREAVGLDDIERDLRDLSGLGGDRPTSAPLSAPGFAGKPAPQPQPLPDADAASFTETEVERLRRAAKAAEARLQAAEARARREANAAPPPGAFAAQPPAPPAAGPAPAAPPAAAPRAPDA